MFYCRPLKLSQIACTIHHVLSPSFLQGGDGYPVSQELMTPGDLYDGHQTTSESSLERFVR